MGKRIKYGNVFFLSFIAGLITYAILFHSSWCSHSPTKEAAVQVAMQDLSSLYNKPESSFDEEYLNKVLLMHGIVKKIQKNEAGNYVLYLGNDPEHGPSFRCSLDALYDHTPPPVRTGDSVTLKGTCAGRLMDIVLIQCIIEK